ncbi:MAG: protein-disulfide reductase DsbD domain-containing protein [Pseudomonadota bacterium]
MRTLCLFILIVANLVTFTVRANAAITNWEDLGGGKARLLAVLNPESGQIDAALEVVLDKGWTTYWRYPGSSGIPPIFDFSQSSGFEFKSIDYPAPKMMGNSELRYAGYKGNVVFPITGLSLPGERPEIALSLIIGVCAEVCIPAKAEFKIAHSELLLSDATAKQIISFSKLKIPQPRKAEEIVVTRRVDANKTLFIEVKHPRSSKAFELFVEGPSNWYLEPAKLMNQTDQTAEFSLDVSRAPSGTDILGQKLKYTLVNGSSGIEFAR